MKWSLKIAQVAGIGIYVHWTLVILLGWILIAHFAQGQSLATIIEGALFVLSLFGCVVLHELGHALTAQRFGVRTRDITLLPIGGVARLERIPEEPWQEFWIAVAGPAVNVVIAAGLLGLIAMLGAIERLSQVRLVGGEFLAKLLWVNIALVVFNLLPAFPMDGGRVLRSLLATRLSRVRATQIAATIGQGMAILFGLGGLLTGNWILLFIALFVYLGAQAEAQATEMRSIFQTARVRDAMNSRFDTLESSDTLGKAANLLLAAYQQDLPVVEGGRLKGILRRSDLLAGLSQSGEEMTVGQAMCRECPAVNPQDRLDQAVALMDGQGCSTLAVTEDGRLVGLLTSENIGEWAMIQAALGERGSRERPQLSVIGHERQHLVRTH